MIAAFWPAQAAALLRFPSWFEAARLERGRARGLRCRRSRAVDGVRRRPRRSRFRRYRVADAAQRVRRQQRVVVGLDEDPREVRMTPLVDRSPAFLSGFPFDAWVGSPRLPQTPLRRAARTRSCRSVPAASRLSRGQVRTGSRRAAQPVLALSIRFAGAYDDDVLQPEGPRRARYGVDVGAASAVASSARPRRAPVRRTLRRLLLARPASRP